MSDNNLSSYINKQKGKYESRQQEIDKQLTENEKLYSILDEMATSQEFDTGDFSKTEVAEAAKFMLKAQPYNIDVTHLKLSDSKVYYHPQTQKSRGRFTRKNLRDYANLMIERARQKKAENDAAEAEEQRKREELAQRNALIEENISVMTLDTSGISLEKEWQRDSDYVTNSENYASSKLFDKLPNVDGFDENLKKAMTGGVGSMFQDRLKTVLSKDIPSYDELSKQITLNMHNAMRGFLTTGQNSKLPKEKIEKERQRLQNQYAETLSVFKRRYKDLQDGKVSPEAFKVFMDSALFTYWDEKQHNIYLSLTHYENKEATKEQEPDTKYQEAVSQLAEGYNNIMIQDDAGGRAIPKSKLKTETSFAVFTGEKFKSNDVAYRFYVTCKSDKHTLMVQKWTETLNKHPELKSKLKFKLGAAKTLQRKDNIVLYVPKSADIDEVQAMMLEFGKECEKDKVLPENPGDNLQATSAIMNGISKAPEFSGDLHKKMTGGYYYDKNEFEEFEKKLVEQRNQEETKKGHKAKGSPSLKFSYNGVIAKAAYLSESMVRQKHGLTPDDSIHDNPELQKEAKDYFNDFIRLAGADPDTLTLK